MELKTMTANEGKVFAYKDANGEEVVLGSILYLGKNDKAEKYYEVDAPVIEPENYEVE